MSTESTTIKSVAGESAAHRAEKFQEESHREALATLLYTINQSEGWALVVGRSGSGKTELISELKAALCDAVTCVQLSAEQCPTPMSLFRHLTAVLEMAGPCQYKARFLLDFRDLIQQYRRQNRKMLIIIDSAQNWSPEMLREIELLGNEDQFSPRVLNIFLLARPEFLGTLESMGATNLKHNLRRFRRLASPCDALPPVGERRTGPRQTGQIDYFDERASREMGRLAGAKLMAQDRRAQAKEAEAVTATAAPQAQAAALQECTEPEPEIQWPESQEEINALLDLVFGPTPPRA